MFSLMAARSRKNHSLFIRGLVGFWKLNETSGTVAVDSSGLGHNGTYSGSNLTLGQTSILPSGTGKSLQITGNSSVVLPSGVYNAITRPITIFGWGKSSNVTPGQQIVASTSGGFNFYLGSSKMTAGVAGISNNAIDSRTMVANTIYFWAVTIDSSGNAIIYVNASPSSTFSAVFNSTTKFVDSVWIGNYPSGPTNNWFNGYLQNVGICNVALTGTEISTIYANS